MHMQQFKRCLMKKITFLKSGVVCFFDLDKMMHWVYLIHFNSRSMQQNTQMYFYNICI